MNRMQSFLQQEQVKAALRRASSLAQRWDVQGVGNRVHRLLEQWQVQERIDRFYQHSVLPHIKRATGNNDEKIDAGLDSLIAQGLELKTASDNQTEEQWKLDIINWLNHGELLLRDNLPDEYRKLTAFAARISPYTDRERLEQVVSERLQRLTEVRRPRRTRGGARHGSGV
jgi:hypothetical protein